MTNDQKQSVIKKIMYCYDTARIRYKVQFPLPILHFHKKSRSAGSVQIRRNRIIISIHSILLVENFKDMINVTIPHEVSHVIVYHLYGKKTRPHGKEWQNIMYDLFNLPADVTHKYDLSDVLIRRQRRFSYLCLCKEHKVTTTCHNKILDGIPYYCNSCDSKLYRKKIQSVINI